MDNKKIGLFIIVILFLLVLSGAVLYYTNNGDLNGVLNAQKNTSTENKTAVNNNSDKMTGENTEENLPEGEMEKVPEDINDPFVKKVNDKLDKNYMVVENLIIENGKEIVTSAKIISKKTEDFGVMILTAEGDIYNFPKSEIKEQSVNNFKVEQLNNITGIVIEKEEVYFLSDSGNKYIEKKDLLNQNYNVRNTNKDITWEFDAENFLYYNGTLNMNTEG